jgi:hypothetical protein
MWSKVHWEMVEPVVKIRTLRARLVSNCIYYLIMGSLVYYKLKRISNIRMAGQKLPQLPFPYKSIFR